MFELNRRGITRTVILTKHYAFKVPNVFYGPRFFLEGLLANYKEAEAHTWSNRFCPVVFSLPFGVLTVMKRLRVLTEKEFAVMYPFFEDVREFKGHDLKADNLGWLDGYIVWLDYGN